MDLVLVSEYLHHNEKACEEVSARKAEANIDKSALFNGLLPEANQWWVGLYGFSPVESVAAELKDADFEWYVSGGWALVTRPRGACRPPVLLSAHGGDNGETEASIGEAADRRRGAVVDGEGTAGGIGAVERRVCDRRRRPANQGAGGIFRVPAVGHAEFRVANIVRDGDLLQQARLEAFSILKQDPQLSLPVHQGLKEAMLRKWEKKLELGSVS